MSDDHNRPSEGEANNGLINGTGDDPKANYRPPDIDADVNEMERKRVDAIINSKIFKEELKKTIQEQMSGGPGIGSILQQMSNIMWATTSWCDSMVLRGGSSCVIPINDIGGIDNIAYAREENMMRCKLASFYRIVDLFGWSQNIYNHITLRVNQDNDQFLINPFGMLYNEVTASSLVKVDMQGNIVEPGTTNLGVNQAGFTLHSAIHASRPDIKCIVHLHLPSVVAISCLKCGLLPISQEAAILGDISYHDYNGILVDPAEKDLIIRNLGPFNKVMLLRNHGVVCCGETVEEAFLNSFYTVLACESQIKVMPLGMDNVILMSEEKRRSAFAIARSGGGGGVNSQEEGVVSTADTKPSHSRRERKWKFGEQEFEAIMRNLDNAGFRTGYMYRQPLIRSDVPRPKYDVEHPPAVSSLGHLLEEEELYGNNPKWKKFMQERKELGNIRCVNSPNVNQNIELLEDQPDVTMCLSSDRSSRIPSEGHRKIHSKMEFGYQSESVNNWGLQAGKEVPIFSKINLNKKLDKTKPVFPDIAKWCELVQEGKEPKVEHPSGYINCSKMKPIKKRRSRLSYFYRQSSVVLDLVPDEWYSKGHHNRILKVSLPKLSDEEIHQYSSRNTTTEDILGRKSDTISIQKEDWYEICAGMEMEIDAQLLSNDYFDDLNIQEEPFITFLDCPNVDS